ncbi:MAG: hypothetical protein ACR2JW_00405 [Thermomicrobiales bacterium]
MTSSCMNDDGQYRQASLDFMAGPEGAAPARAVSPRRQPPRPRNQFHTPMPANRRLHDDLWQEYRLECDVREREGLPFVSLPEFAAMRDWADRVDEPQDVAWPAIADDGSAEQRRLAM